VPNVNYIVSTLNRGQQEDIVILASGFSIFGDRSFGRNTPVVNSPEGQTLSFHRQYPNPRYDPTRTNEPEYYEERLFQQECAMFINVIRVRLELDVTEEVFEP
jgi:hypothetical protein